MLIQTKHLLTTLVVAGISMAALPAKAATFAAGDLLVGFRATAGTGSATNLIVNIGSSSTLRDNNTTSTSLINLGNSVGTALYDTYGSDWATRTDLWWGVIGVRDTNPFGAVTAGDPNNTLYFSAPQTLSGSPVIGQQKSTFTTAISDTTIDAVGNKFSTVQAAFAGDTLSTTYNSGRAVAIGTGTSSWQTSGYATGSTGTDFSTSRNVEAAVGTAAGSVLDLYRVLNGNPNSLSTASIAETGFVAGKGQWQGTVSLSSAGVISFDPVTAAVPEPSRALFLACGLSSLFLRRRRAVRA